MNGAGRGTLPVDHPLNFQLTRRDAFADADVIVIVGTPFDFRLRYGKSLKAPTVVQIDMYYATIGRNRDIALGIVGDVGVILVGGDACRGEERATRLSRPRGVGFRTSKARRRGDRSADAEAAR